MAKKKAAAEQLPAVAADAPDELAVFRKQDAIIAELRVKFMALKINGVDDKEGFDAVHKARMLVKNTRIDVEKTRTEHKAGVLERGRKIDGEAKRVTELMAPIEKYLEDQETAITKERERIKREAEAAQAAKIKQRFDDLQSCGYTGDRLAAVPAMTDEAFGHLLSKAQAEKALRDRAAAEERQRQEAREAELAAEKKRLEEVAKQQEAEAAQLRAERERIEAAAKPPTTPEQIDEMFDPKKPTPFDAVQPAAAIQSRPAPQLDFRQEHNHKIVAFIAAIHQVEVPEVPDADDIREVIAEACRKILAITVRPPLAAGMRFSAPIQPRSLAEALP